MAEASREGPVDEILRLLRAWPGSAADLFQMLDEIGKMSLATTIRKVALVEQGQRRIRVATCSDELVVKSPAGDLKRKLEGVL